MKPQESFIERAASGVLERQEVDAFCHHHDIRAADFFNLMSLQIAKDFDAGELDFWSANYAMNRIYTFVVDDAAQFGDGFEFPEPAYSIYCAFDAGEWDRGDGSDPVSTYTVPEIKKILSGA